MIRTANGLLCTARLPRCQRLSARTHDGATGRCHVEALMSTSSALQRFSSLPDRIICPPLSTQPMDSPPHNLSLPNSNNFLSDRNHNQTHTLSKNNSRSLSTHGLHIPPHLDSRHHRFFTILFLFPRLPPPPENCSSLEAM